MSENQPYKKQFKLDEISKKETFTVPDGYFDKLPTIIQTRAIESTKKSSFVSVGALRLALPALLLILIAGYWGYKYQNSYTVTDSNIEAMLAEVSTEQLVSYLEESDVTSDELLELVSFEGESLDDIPSGIDNLSDEDLDQLIDEYDFENENSI